MTGTICTGWDRNDRDEWAKLPGPIMRWVMVMRFRKEMRAL
jgi:hypothetical protein